MHVRSYYAFVFRADRRPDVDVFAWDLRHPLPSISIPLKGPDPDVALDLAAVVDNAYERGRYTRKLRYSVPPPGPLSPDGAAWAADLARNPHTHVG